MPELPELDIVCEVLERRAIGWTIAGVDIVQPGGAIVVRDLATATAGPLATAALGLRLEAVRRRGKFLVFDLRAEPPYGLVINPKLSGRLQLAEPGEKRRKDTCLVLTLTGPGAASIELRYFDPKTMGQIYVTGDPARVPDFAEMGPEALEISLADFKQRLRPFRGEIKGILVRSAFVAGIGNAYADEILWAAELHPYRKRTTLNVAEIERLYAAMRSTLLEARDLVRAEMGDAIHLKPRDFMKVHLRAGQPCPRCGGPIAEISANQRITNFCRACQPGGLIKGL
ncbi:MAG TPA: DNA-formamidopyrimidine glycosylase family protein [Anaerolineales bacterium]|nr:DNA-formamidopyrimidine glycosylase family protein [Anaerolineales bacterium]